MFMKEGIEGKDPIVRNFHLNMAIFRIGKPFVRIGKYAFVLLHVTCPSVHWGCHFMNVNFQKKSFRGTRQHACAPLLALAIIAVSLCSMRLAHAQTEAGTLLNQEQRSQQRLPERLPPAQATPNASRPEAGQGPRVSVRAIRFTGGSDLLSAAELQALVSPYVGTDLDFAGLEGIALAVTDLLRSRGWFLAEAYLPRQDITQGDIEIAIKAGLLDGKAGRGTAFSIQRTDQDAGEKRPLRIQQDRLESLARKHLPAGATVNERAMERALLLMNDLPGISARAKLQAGIEEGSTQVVIDVDEGPLFSGSVNTDNFGNGDTGLEQVNVAAQLNDVSGYGDQISLNATDAQGMLLARLGYSLPIGSDGLKLALARSTMQYKILRGVGLDAALAGTSATTGLTLSYPWLRSRNQNLYGALGITRKTLLDDSTAGALRDKRIDVFTGLLSGDLLDTHGGGGLVTWSLGLTSGTLDLSNQANDSAADAATYNTQGRYAKLSYGASRLQKLPGAFSLWASLSGQVAQKNLDSSEKFILGGPNGVRAYSGSEGSGDEGWLGTLEVRYDVSGGTALGQLQLFGFYDTGAISLHKEAGTVPISTASAQNRYRLAAWGLGLGLSKTSSHALRIVWARKVGDNPGRSSAGLDADGRADAARLWLQATLWF